MPSRPWLYRKTLPISLTRGMWLTLAKLVVVIGYENHKKGYEPPKLVDVIGVLLTKAVVELAEDTHRRFQEVRAKIELQAHPGFYSLEHLDAIASAPAESVFYAIRLGWEGQPASKHRVARGRKLIRELRARPEYPLLRLAEESATLRRGAVRIAAGGSEWVKAALGIDPLRSSSARSSNLGL
jgi:hypothetical protein